MPPRDDQIPSEMKPDDCVQIDGGLPECQSLRELKHEDELKPEDQLKARSHVRIDSDFSEVSDD